MSAATLPGSFVSTYFPSGAAKRIVGSVVLAFLGSAVMTLAAKTEIYAQPVPITLQTLAIFGLAAAFGRNLAVATMLLYLAQGLVGLPVFAGPVAGPAYMASHTGGYLAGFVIAAAIVGQAADRGWSRSPFKMFGAMLVADILVFALGFAWLASLIGPNKAWLGGVVPFIVADLVKIALASALVAALWKLFRRA